jgi:hypothetical protein
MLVLVTLEDTLQLKDITVDTEMEMLQVAVVALQLLVQLQGTLILVELVAMV